MGAFIAKQPNGLYCRFSTVVDCPTDWNMTEEDYIEMCAEMARQQARETLTRYLRPFEMVKEYFRPNNMTEAEFEECLNEMSKTEQLKEKGAIAKATTPLLFLSFYSFQCFKILSFSYPFFYI